MLRPEAMDETYDKTMQQPMEPAVRRTGRARARLTVVFPPEMKRSVALGTDEVVFGRKPERGERIDHGTVSRRHLAVRYDATGDAYFAVELGSRNGSRTAGNDLTAADGPRALSDGDVVRIGDVLMVFERSPALNATESAEVSRDAIAGEAARTVALRAAVALAGPDPAPALLIGETGTGKEFIARELHRLSARQGRLVAVNCAALSPQLIESQLFGHRKGAFTGADTAHEGLFRAATGGTIFLDEIGELPPALQPKLLRVLQEREVLPVGETRPIKVDVRVVAATLRDLSADAEADIFRLDLYARLSTFELRVPSLRQRRADLPVWIERMHAAWYRERGQSPPPVPLEANALERLMVYRWPDNLRGLQRIVHLGASRGDEVYDLPPELVAEAMTATAPPAAAQPPRGETPSPAPAGRRKRMPRPSKEELLRVLEAHAFSVRATAKHYDRERRQIYRWLEHYDLRDRGQD